MPQATGYHVRLHVAVRIGVKGPRRNSESRHAKIGSVPAARERLSNSGLQILDERRWMTHYPPQTLMHTKFALTVVVFLSWCAPAQAALSVTISRNDFGMNSPKRRITFDEAKSLNDGDVITDEYLNVDFTKPTGGQDLIFHTGGGAESEISGDHISFEESSGMNENDPVRMEFHLAQSEVAFAMVPSGAPDDEELTYSFTISSGSESVTMEETITPGDDTAQNANDYFVFTADAGSDLFTSIEIDFQETSLDVQDTFDTQIDDLQLANAVPEPGSMTVLATGAVGLGFGAVRRRRKRQASAELEAKS